MADRFYIADLHVGHKGIVTFARDDGSPLRPPFGRVPTDENPMSPEEQTERVLAMDEAMIERWNAVVKPGDKVEVLGDAAINRHAIPLFGRMNGRKRLRMGNHDIFVKHNNRDYQPYFEEITGYKVMVKEGLILSHIPIHRDSVKQRWLANVHGHLHDGRVMIQQAMPGMRRRAIPGTRRMSWPQTIYETVIDPVYFCVSVEHIDYTPIEHSVLLTRINEQRREFDERPDGYWQRRKNG